MRNILFGGIALGLLVATPAFATNPPPAPAPPKDKITIDIVTLNGSGCPLLPNGQSSAAVAMSPDNTAFTVTFSDYIAQVGPRIPAKDLRKNCQMNVKV